MRVTRKHQNKFWSFLLFATMNEKRGIHEMSPFLDDSRLSLVGTSDVVRTLEGTVDQEMMAAGRLRLLLSIAQYFETN